VNTTANEPAKTRRRRRKHSDEFKAQAVAACRHAGVSIAAIALANGVNANLLRRWILDADQLPRDRRLPAVARAPATPSFIPVPLAERAAPPDIRIELHRGTTAISVTWPTSAAADCAAWMRELLR
jgi:transposase